MKNKLYILLFLLTCTQTAFGAPVTLTFSGDLIQYTYGSYLANPINYVASFSYESNVVKQNPQSFSLNYNTGVNLNLNGINIDTTRYNITHDYDYIIFGVSLSEPQLFQDGSAIDFVYFNFEGLLNTLSTLPESVSDLSTSISSYSGAGNEFPVFTGTINSIKVIPLPNMAPLFLLSLVGMIRLSRK